MEGSLLIPYHMLLMEGKHICKQLGLNTGRHVQLAAAQSTRHWLLGQQELKLGFSYYEVLCSKQIWCHYTMKLLILKPYSMS